MAESKTCPRCSTEFEPRRANQSYCTRACKDLAHSLRQRENVRPECAIDGCSKKATAPSMKRPLCSMHYGRLKRTGDVGPVGTVRGGRMGVTPCSVSECPRTYYADDLCALHYNRRRNSGSVGAAGVTKRANGEGTIAIVDGYRRLQWYVNGKRVAIAEHRQVMEQMLGRPLGPFESVHHKNGRRSDNAPSNLELWVKPQPAGQRPEDLVNWVLDNYADLVEVEQRARKRERETGQLRLTN